METTINTSSRNEVKDLLNEYVVSPLNIDLDERLKNLSEEIKSIGEGTKDIEKNLSIVNGGIERLRMSLDKSFHFADEEDIFNNLEGMIEDSQETILSSTNKIKEAQENAIERLTDSSKQIKGSFERVENQLSDIQSFGFERIPKIEKLISTNNDELGEKIDTQLHIISDNFTELNIATKNYYEDIKKLIDSVSFQQELLIKRKYKNVFVASFSLGVINVVGIVVMMILFLIK